jgi:ribosome biogenesis protein BMS1|tara:strand:+ start:291 stop:698 length:408 start_codon:yes stop_codon:yes gene_type:complete
VRKERRFNPLRISKKIQQGLPFASKPKLKRATSAPSKKRKRESAIARLRRAVVGDDHDRQVHSVLQAVRTIRKVKRIKRKQKYGEKVRKFQEKEAKKVEKHFSMQMKERKKAAYRKEGKNFAAAKRKAEGNGGRR